MVPLSHISHRQILQDTVQDDILDSPVLSDSCSSLLVRDDSVRVFASAVPRSTFACLLTAAFLRPALEAISQIMISILLCEGKHLNYNIGQVLFRNLMVSLFLSLRRTVCFQSEVSCGGDETYLL